MKPMERYGFIAGYLAARGRPNLPHTVDVLDSDFVYAYIEHADAPCALMPFGAPKCPQLGRDLSTMHAAGVLARAIVSLQPGDASMGFPKWVYVYRLEGE